MKTYGWTHICVISVQFPTRYENTWKFFTAAQQKGPVCQSMIIRWKGTHCFHGNICFRFMNMATMWHHSIIISFKNMTFNFTIPSVVRFVTLILSFVRNDNTILTSTNSYFLNILSTHTHQ